MIVGLRLAVIPSASIALLTVDGRHVATSPPSGRSLHVALARWRRPVGLSGTVREHIGMARMGSGTVMLVETTKCPRRALAMTLLAAVVLGAPGPASADYTARIDPATTGPTWEGWGTSLAWWAKAFGDRDDIA